MVLRMALSNHKGRGLTTREDSVLRLVHRGREYDAGAFVDKVGVGWALVGASIILSMGAALLSQERANGCTDRPTERPLCLSQ